MTALNQGGCKNEQSLKIIEWFDDCLKSEIRKHDMKIIMNNMRDYVDLFNEQLEKKQYKQAHKTLDALIENATAYRKALFPANAGHQQLKMH